MMASWAFQPLHALAGGACIGTLSAGTTSTCGRILGISGTVKCAPAPSSACAVRFDWALVILKIPCSERYLECVRSACSTARAGPLGTNKSWPRAGAWCAEASTHGACCWWQASLRVASPPPRSSRDPSTCCPRRILCSARLRVACWSAPALRWATAAPAATASPGTHGARVASP